MTTTRSSLPTVEFFFVPIEKLPGARSSINRLAPDGKRETEDGFARFSRIHLYFRQPHKLHFHTERSTFLLCLLCVSSPFAIVC